jgi:hypothetical protein
MKEAAAHRGLQIWRRADRHRQLRSKVASVGPVVGESPPDDLLQLLLGAGWWWSIDALVQSVEEQPSELDPLCRYARSLRPGKLRDRFIAEVKGRRSDVLLYAVDPLMTDIASGLVKVVAYDGPDRREFSAEALADRRWRLRRDGALILLCANGQELAFSQATLHTPAVSTAQIAVIEESAAGRFVSSAQAVSWIVQGRWLAASDSHDEIIALNEQTGATVGRFLRGGWKTINGRQLLNVLDARAAGVLEIEGEAGLRTAEEAQQLDVLAQTIINETGKSAATLAAELRAQVREFDNAEQQIAEALAAINRAAGSGDLNATGIPLTGTGHFGDRVGVPAGLFDGDRIIDLYSRLERRSGAARASNEPEYGKIRFRAADVMKLWPHPGAAHISPHDISAPSQGSEKPSSLNNSPAVNRRRRGHADADKPITNSMKQLVDEEKLSVWAAAEKLTPTAPGHGTYDSKAKRLTNRFYDRWPEYRKQ